MKKLYQSVDFPEVIEILESFGSSELAKELLRNTAKLKNQEEALQSFQEILSAKDLLALGRRPKMESLDLFSTWFERVKREAVLKIIEILDVKRFCGDVFDLKDAVKNLDSNWSLYITHSLFDPLEPISAIDQIINESGEIRTDASELLSNLFNEKKIKEQQLRGLLHNIVKSHNMESLLQDKFVTNRQGRWVIPIKSGMKHHFQGIIHESSHTKQTVFMEPQESINFNNDLREIEIKIEKEIERLLTQLSHYLSGLVREFQKCKEVLLKADVKLAQAQLAVKMSAQAVHFSDTKLKLVGVKHPIMNMLNPKTVSNDIELNHDNRVLILSGPNAGGKTVLLKGVALASLMSRCGLLICAKNISEIPFFEDIIVAAFDEQSVEENLSTFAAHLKSLNRATEFHGFKTLIIVDEICSSTDPEEGASLARAFIEEFATNNVFSLITSHFNSVKNNWESNSGVINAKMDFNQLEGQPTFKLHIGQSGQSMGIKVAESVGVKSHIIEKALRILHPDVLLKRNQIEEMNHLKSETLELKTQLQSEVVNFHSAKEKYLGLVQKFRNEKDKWLKKSIDMFNEKIDNMIAKNLEEKSNEKHLKKLKEEFPKIIKSSEKSEIKSSEDFSKLCPPGSVVYITNLRQDGIVQSLPDSKGMVTILSKSMRLQLTWQELLPTKLAPPSQGQTSLQQAFSKSEFKVDLRGKKVDEALSVLETLLDRATVNNVDRVKIIHGHGTDALKKSIRTFLSRSLYVRKWKAAEQESGGDGVTWVELVN